MTDIATEAPAEASAPTETTPAPKPPKPVVQPHPCLCQTFELFGTETVNGEPEEVTYQSECGLNTKGTFAQGHDARLVSFLVDGHRDGYSIRQTVNGNATKFDTPAQAVASISEALRNKAEKATANMKSKQQAKQDAAKEREAKKAARQAEKAQAAAAKETKKAEAKNTGEVVAGSTTGDVAPLAEGQVRIKAGRWEYVATKNADGGVTFVDGKGETQVRAEGDGYTVLEG
jgi:hypothetical protein